MTDVKVCCECKSFYHNPLDGIRFCTLLKEKRYSFQEACSEFKDKHTED